MVHVNQSQAANTASGQSFRRPRTHSADTDDGNAGILNTQRSVSAEETCHAAETPVCVCW
jgi:hypothetical protein